MKKGSDREEEKKKRREKNSEDSGFYICNIGQCWTIQRGGFR